MLQQKGPDYGAMIIKGSAGVVIAISLTLIFLVVGNMIYQTLSNKVVLRERVKKTIILNKYFPPPYLFICSPVDSIICDILCGKSSSLTRPNIFIVMDHGNARQLDGLGAEERFRYRDLSPVDTAQRNRMSRTAANVSASIFRPMPSNVTNQPTTSGGNVSNRQPQRLTRAAFCPCFSPNVSDGEDSSDDQGSGAIRNARNRTDSANRQLASSRESARRQILSVARDFRARLAFAADTNSQPEAASSGIRRFPQNGGIIVSDEPYIVHTSVDYTNCLVPAQDRITASSYYWGVMDRYEAEALLDGKPEGTFLLRDSAQSEYLFSVSFRRYKRTLHARIEQKNHRFSFDFSDTSIFSAETITDLIAYYKDPAKCLFFEPQLSIPLPRNFVFSLQHICRARIASLTTYDGVNDLSLPVALKQYIQEYFYKHPVKTVNHIPRPESLRLPAAIPVTLCYSGMSS